MSEAGDAFTADLNRQIELWGAIAAAIARGAPREQILAGIAEAACTVLPSAAVGLAQQDVHTGKLEIQILRPPAAEGAGVIAVEDEWLPGAVRSDTPQFGLDLEALPAAAQATLRGLDGDAAPGSRLTSLPVPSEAGGDTSALLIVHAGAVPDDRARACLSFLARQTGVALRDQALARQSRSAADRLVAVNEIGRALISTLSVENLDGLYSTIRWQVAGILDVDAFLIGLYDDQEEDVLRLVYLFDDGEAYPGTEQPLGTGPAAQAIRHRQLLLFNTPDELAAQGALQLGHPGHTPASALFVPMLSSERVIGVVSVQSYCPHAYGEEDCRLLAIIADQAAVAIENVRLYQDVRARLQRVSILHEVALATTASFDFDQIIAETLTTLQRASGLEHVGLALLNERGDRLIAHPAYAGRPPSVSPQSSVALGEGLAGWVAQTGLPARVDDVRTDARCLTAGPGTRAALCVPLRVNDVTIGVINVESRRAGAFSLEDEQLVAIAAGQLAPLVDRARLFAEAQRRVRELAVLYDAGTATAALLNPRAILQAVVEHMARAVDATSACVFEWDEEQELVRTVSEYYSEQATVRERISDLGGAYPIADFAADAEMIRDDKPFAVSVSGARTSTFQRKLLREHGAVCALIIPLVSKQQVLGYAELSDSRREREWTADEIRLCQTIAVQATTGLEKAGLFEEARRRVAELTALQEITTRLTLSLELSDVLDAVVASVMRLVRPSDVHIYLWDAASEEFTFGTALWADGSRTPAAAPRADGITAQVVRGSMPVIINDAQNHPLFQGEREKAWEVRAIAGFPLLHAGEVIGAFTLAFLEPHTFTPDELRMLGMFADHASIAVRNARLYAEARQRAAELSTLQRSSLEMTASLDLRTVLDSITENALRLVQARDVHLYVYDDEAGEFTLGVARWDIKVSHAQVHVPRKEGLTAQVVRERRPIIIDDTEGHPFFSNPEAQAWGIRSIAGFPLKRAERLLGIFNVAFSAQHTFTLDELRVLTLLGDQAAVAIDNARLYEEAQRRAEQVSALLATTAIISSTLDLDTRLQTITEKAKALIEADGCTLFSFEDDGLILRPLVSLHPYQSAIAGLRVRLGEGLTGRVAAMGQGEIVNHAQGNPRAAPIPGTPDEPECLMSVPLLVQERVIGVMTVQRIGDREFRAADLELLSSFASQAATAIDNARLYHELQVRAQTLQRAYDELAEADRLKDELVQNVSHELRTPLTFIKGYVELLVSGELGEMQQEQLDSLKIVLSKTDVLVRLVSDVVSLQAISPESLELAEVHLPDMAQRALAGVGRAAENAGLALQAEIAPDLPPVFADVDRLAQVFDNLLGNAIKFSNRGGTIIVRMFRQDADVRVEVQDCGIGIPADKHKRIFERFYQVDGTTTRRFGGAGLGLAICKQIIEAHHGTIGVAWSEVGHGTTFYFTLAAGAQAPAAVTGEAAASKD